MSGAARSYRSTSWPPTSGLRRRGDSRVSWGDPDLAVEPVEAPGVPPPAPIDWAALYGNSHPVEVEVGFGKGLFLVNSAVANPGVNYFGVEIIRKYQLYATNRVASRGLANARTCWGDARRVLGRHVLPGTVAAVHVYFPDRGGRSGTRNGY